MSPIFTFIVITLALLAIFDIIVGVANDAVNFLNSAIGSKIAPMKVILGVAAVGILVGTLTSSGMMEVARSGVFYPSQFTFSEIMFLFLAMIIGDILLLDIFNNLGLPTSTTVSMVFGLLGAAVGVAVYRISTDSGYVMSDLSQFINTGKAMAIISAILLSVVLSFFFGLFFMYISRLIFSFRYKTVFSKMGALWCGISFTGIIYFSIFKGLKSTGLIPVEVTDFIHNETLLSLFLIWMGSSLILWVLQLMKVNLLKITILAGTFALALAFAGNDLVNFIGVPLAGLDSYNLALASGDMDMTMEALMQPAHANKFMLAGSGLIMVLTLVFSKKALHVAQTELSLASQNDSNTEKFSSSAFSRVLVQGAISISNFYTAVTPRSMREAIGKRFEQLPAAERGDSTYDLIRAAVNLTAAAILISIATSLKLPLSTTYVVFMVAMGSSLADKAWGRESAVYRISGVVTVVMGWFLTALAGFTLAFTIATIIIWGGNIVLIAVVAISVFIAVKSNFFNNKNKAEEKLRNCDELLQGTTKEDVLVKCTKEVLGTTEETIKIYNRTLVALFKENRKVLKEANGHANELYMLAKDRKHNLLTTLNKLEDSHVDTGHFYVQVVDYLSEVTKCLMSMTQPALEHIDNHHQGLSKEQVHDLMSVNNDVEEIFTMINEMLESRDFSQIDDVLDLRDKLFDKIVDATKKQLRRIKADPEHSSTRANMLYLNLLAETKSMVLQVRNLVKSQRLFLSASNNN